MSLLAKAADWASKTANWQINNTGRKTFIHIIITYRENYPFEKVLFTVKMCLVLRAVSLFLFFQTIQTGQNFLQECEHGCFRHTCVAAVVVE